MFDTITILVIPLVSQFLIILGENGKLQLLQTVHILELRPALVLFVTKLNKKMFQPTEFIPGLIGKLLLIYVQKKKKPIDPVHIVILKKLPSSQLLIMYGENGTLIKSRLYLKLVCVCVIA